LIEEINIQRKQATNRLAYLDQPVHPQPAQPPPPLVAPVVAEAKTAPLQAEEEAPLPAEEEAPPPQAEQAAPPPPPAAQQQVDFVIAEPISPSENEVHIVIHSPLPTLNVPPNRI
jgi:hypothetical protein